VETDAQLAFLRQYGCEVYQGWLFAKAMGAEELTKRLRA
jgi:sensor c-di-GMP phosphodiesterase-like protein